MAGNVNKVFLMGNLTRDVEMRALPSGMSVGSFGIAVNERFKDRDGNWQERANFVDCEIFGARAEAFAKYLSKGSPVFLEGRLRLDQWQDKEGNNRSKLKVVVEDFQFVGGGQGGGGGGGAGAGGGARGGSRGAPVGAGADEPAIDHDDIPF